MVNPLSSKLSQGADLTAEDLARLDALVSNISRVPARTDLIRQGEAPSDVRLVVNGFACRYKLLQDGSRSIMAFLLPGDFCDLHVAILGHMDHSISTITECDVVAIPNEEIDDIMARFPRIARAFWWATLVDAGTLREWLVSMGRRRSDRQMAHLFCELLVRLSVIEQAGEQSFRLPLTQEELADTLGITPVHAHRVLISMREKGLLTLQDRNVAIPDVERLKEFAGFDDDYLHLRRRAFDA